MTEALVVLLLLGLATAAVVPRLGLMPSSLEAKRAEAAILDACGAAQHMSLATGESVDVVYDLGAHEWRVRTVKGKAEPVAAGVDAEVAAEQARDTAFIYGDFQRFAVSPDLELQAADGTPIDAWSATAEGPAVVIHYYPDGGANSAAYRMVLAPRVWTLEVDRLTGRPLLVEVKRP